MTPQEYQEAEIERQRIEIDGLRRGMMLSLEPGLPGLLAENAALRAEHDEAWRLIDRLAEALNDFEPSHDWLIEEANKWLGSHPKAKQA